jgi:hypothetical protein
MSKKTSSRPRVLSSGKLRIGDEWNAINIIARTQTHPLKAICELAENALDAGAGEVVILRRRVHHDFFLEVSDDGNGIQRDADGVPDFARIATHVCDSMKRQLEKREREGVHGEFGIGLLSFWGLGENLRIVSHGADGRLYEMQLGRGARTYTIRPVRGELSTGGTRVIVGPLLPATRNIVTGEKLQRYLSEELRDRIRNRKATVKIFDRVSHKQFAVEPREFAGERLSLAPRCSTRCGDLLVELHFTDGQAAEQGVAVCKDGTRVLRDITELEQFQHSPWTDRRLEGVLDFAALGLSPGTRSGIEPDDKLMAFIDAVQAIEPAILQELAGRDEAESARASRDILRQVHKAFVSALRDLPANEYLFFDIPESRSGKSAASPDERQPAAGRIDLQEEKPILIKADDETGQLLLPLVPGPLATVTVTPRNARRVAGKQCGLTAQPHDSIGIPIDTGVAFHWSIVDGSGTFAEVDGAKCKMTCADPENVTVAVEARKSGLSASDQVQVKFLPDLGTGADEPGKGLPSYRLEPEHGRPWRSRYDVARNEIIINSAHRDFIAAKNTAAKHRRYVGKLYAKEVVLINFPHGSPADVLERLVEITLRTEDVL